VATPVLEHLSQDALIRYDLPPIQPVTELPRRSRRAFTLSQKIGYSLMLLVIAFFLVQFSRSILTNLTRLERLFQQDIFVAHAYEQAQLEQTQLEGKIKRATSSDGMEEMARERLGMVGPKEIMIRIHTQRLAQAEKPLVKIN
jgi:cell division protein FtsB